jgi:hypothetical protein
MVINPGRFYTIFKPAQQAITCKNAVTHQFILENKKKYCLFENKVVHLS